MTTEIKRRTFDAAKYPEDSAERRRLNGNAETSEYMTSKKYIAYVNYEETRTRFAYSRKQTFATKKDAQDWIDSKLNE